MANVKDFKPFQHVQFHPATDIWMRGERYGTVISIGVTHVYVEGDVTKKLYRLDPGNILPIEGVSFC